jgi:hypothetical protein
MCFIYYLESSYNDEECVLQKQNKTKHNKTENKKEETKLEKTTNKQMFPNIPNSRENI